MVKSKTLERQKRAYIAYMVYLIRAKLDHYLPVQYASFDDLEKEIEQTEADIIALDIELSKKTKNEFQLN